MRKILLLNCLLFLPFLIFSQEAVKKTDSALASRLYLDVSGGVSIPMGYYAMDDVKSGGLATRGILAQLNLDWIGKYNYGLALQYTFQMNPLKSSVRNDTLEGLGQPLGKGSWSNHYLMIGIVFLKTFHKFYFEGKALVGIVLSFSPVFKTTDPFYKTPSTNTGTGFAYGVQLGAGYAVSQSVTIKANIEYIAGNPQIHRQYGAQVIGIDTSGKLIYSPPLNFDTKRTISALLVKAGVVIKLSK
jgi:hypothetical protein